MEAIPHAAFFQFDGVIVFVAVREFGERGRREGVENGEQENERSRDVEGFCGRASLQDFQNTTLNFRITFKGFRENRVLGGSIAEFFIGWGMLMADGAK